MQILLLTSLFITGIVLAQPSDHDYRQDDKVISIEERINKHLESASGQLAAIEVKMNIIIGLGLLILTGFIIPWIKKKLFIWVLFALVLGISGCTVPKTIEVCQIPPCRNYCFTQQECHPSCYCGRDGLCRNR